MKVTTASRAEGIRRRALKALRDGQVQVRKVLWNGTRAETVDAVVSGFTGRHVVELRDDRWTCSCKEGSDGSCPHAAAVRLVTGHAGEPGPAGATVTPLHQPTAPAAVDDDGEQGELDCKHGMVASWCGDCTGRDGGEAERAREREHLLSLPGWTVAAYKGRCHHCGDPYAAGDPIRLTPGDGRSAWAGVCCGRR